MRRPWQQLDQGLEQGYKLKQAIVKPVTPSKGFLLLGFTREYQLTNEIAVRNLREISKKFGIGAGKLMPIG